MSRCVVMLALVLLCPLFWGAENIGVFVSASTADPALTRERVVELLTGRSATVGDNRRVTLVLSFGEGGSQAVQQLVSRDVTRLLRGWKRLVFGSGGSMPLTAPDDQAALALAVRTPQVLMPWSGPIPVNLPPQLRFIPTP